MQATDRVDPPHTGAERETLRAFLDFHRATLAMKCEGLSDEDLGRQSRPPSTLSLLGLVRHLAEVERAWFRRVIDGEDVAAIWWTPRRPTPTSTTSTTADGAEAFATWQAEVAHARADRAAAASLDVTTSSTAGARSLAALVMLHLIEEYARHNGHADLLREAIDGATGE